MRTFQVTYLIGRLGHDPEMKYAPEGQPVTKFSLATDRPAKIVARRTPRRNPGR